MVKRNGLPTLVGRRKYLKQTGATVFGLAGLGNVASAGKSKIDIPIHKSGDKVIRYKKVDRDWWDYYEKANAVYKRFLQRYARKQGVEAVGLIRGEEKHSYVDRYKLKIDISVLQSSDQEARSIESDVPTSVDGIPIEVTTTREWKDTGPQDDHDPVIGGVTGGAQGNEGTLTCKVSYAGDEFMMTAKHLFFDNRCDPDDTLEYADQNGDYFGQATAHWQEYDISLIAHDTYGYRDELSNKIYTEPGEVTGHMSFERIGDFMTQGKQVIKKGKVSGKKTGTIEGRYGTITCNEGEDIHRMLRVNTNQFPGDSGAPIFERFEPVFGDPELWIAAPATQAQGYSARGVGAYYIHNKEGVEFGG